MTDLEKKVSMLECRIAQLEGFKKGATEGFIHRLKQIESDIKYIEANYSKKRKIKED